MKSVYFSFICIFLHFNVLVFCFHRLFLRLWYLCQKCFLCTFVSLLLWRKHRKWFCKIALEEGMEQISFLRKAMKKFLFFCPHSAHGDAWCLYRSHFQSSSYTVKYHRTSQDDMGRIYPTTFAAQALPRSLRLVLFASTHSEIDMWGAHYEIVRRFGPPMI